MILCIQHCGFMTGLLTSKSSLSSQNTVFIWCWFHGLQLYVVYMSSPIPLFPGTQVVWKRKLKLNVSFICRGRFHYYMQLARKVFLCFWYLLCWLVDFSLLIFFFFDLDGTIRRTFFLSDSTISLSFNLGQVIQPQWASISSCIKWGCSTRCTTVPLSFSKFQNYAVKGVEYST